MNIKFLHRTTIITLLLTILSTTANATDWLGRISDDMPVCRLSIPGTHDAATGEGFVDADTLAGNYIARTQELTLAKQWEAGIRAFDLRPDLATDSLGMQKMTVFHGEFATNTSFSAVISMLRDSLRAHPTEFAIIIMRHESSPNRESSHWADRMDYILALNSDLLVDFRPDITVGQLRGRILLLSRDKYDRMPHGAFVEGWRHDGIIDTANPATILEMVRAGICCGIVAESTAQGYEQGIRYYSFEKPLRWNVAVSYPKGAFLNQAENLFIQQAREYWMQKAKVQSAEQK